METPIRAPSVKSPAHSNGELKPEKTQRLAIRTDLATLEAESDYPLAVDLKSCRGGQLDENIEEDIRDYETQQEEFRRKNKWTIFSMLYIFDCWLLSLTSHSWAHQIWWIVVVLMNLPALLLAFGHLAISVNNDLQEIFAYVIAANLTITITVRNELLLTGLYYSFNYIPF